MDNISPKIRKVLQEVCPAFSFNPHGGPAEWHCCECLAQNLGPCNCVWHITDTCIAGTWPQLVFVNEIRKQEQLNSDKYLQLAKTAIAKAKGK